MIVLIGRLDHGGDIIAEVIKPKKLIGPELTIGCWTGRIESRGHDLEASSVSQASIDSGNHWSRRNLIIHFIASSLPTIPLAAISSQDVDLRVIIQERWADPLRVYRLRNDGFQDETQNNEHGTDKNQSPGL